MHSVLSFSKQLARSVDEWCSSELPVSALDTWWVISSLINKETALPWLSGFLTRKATLAIVIVSVNASEVGKVIQVPLTTEDMVVEKGVLYPFITTGRQNPARPLLFCFSSLA